MGAYAPADLPIYFHLNKKHQSHLGLWCKHFYALHITLPGKPLEIGIEYPDLVLCGVSPRALFRKAFPDFTRVTGAPAPIGKNITPYSAVSALGIFTPFLCTLRQLAKPCS